MTDQNKAMTALVRSMKKALQDQHGIKVPHAALRASYLQARGENPHAFAAKQLASNDGAKPGKAVLVESKDVTAKEDRPVSCAAHTLYLAEDHLGCLELISLDALGDVLLPEGWEFKKSTLKTVAAHIPRVSKYGLPDYLAVPAVFFEEFAPGLTLAPDFKNSFVDMGDDSGDSCSFEVEMDNSEWLRLIEAVLVENPAFNEAVAEWVGVHYRHLFDQQSSSEKAQWVERYLESSTESDRDDDATSDKD